MSALPINALGGAGVAGGALPQPTRAQLAEAAFLVAPPPPDDWARYLAHHSRSFRFAASLLPPGRRERVATVYAYCRYTDDLVDRVAGSAPGLAGALVDAWVDRSRAAYEGERTGIPLLDRVMRDMARAGVPFHYAAELSAGMRMDLAPRTYETLGDLRVYTYRVASVVGLWLTELEGVRDAWALERASLLGHALQLTNILRDVGEDWDRGRLYLPRDRMRAHGVTTDDLARMRRGTRRVTDGFRALVEELMAVAESDYRTAEEAIPVLGPAFAPAVAVAAGVYEGIHDAIRRNGHDTLTRRAFTTPREKVALAARALWRLRSAPGRPARVPCALAAARTLQAPPAA